MAYSAATGFRFRKTVYGLEHPGTVDILLANSATLKIGDLVRVNTAGFLVRCAAGDAVGGVLVGIVDVNGINVFSPRAQGLAGATLTPDDQIASASDNQTVKFLKGQVIIDPAGICLFENVADGTIGQTNLFQMADATNGNQIATGGLSDSNGQMQLIVLDPDGTGSTTKGLFRIHENQFGMGIDTGTAKVAA